MLTFAGTAKGAPVAATERIDARIAVDASGDTPALDAARAMLEALAERLPAGSLAGVWVGGAPLAPRVPYRAVDDDWRKLLRVVSAALKGGAGTPDLRSAFEQLAWDADVGQSRRDLFLITSASRGSVGDPDAAARRAVIETLLPRLARAGFRVHVATAPSTPDAPFLRQLAASTGGVAGIVDGASAARELLDRAFARDGAAATDGSFLIDGVRDEVTVVAAHRGRHMKLVSPAAQVIDANVVSAFVRWFEQDDRTVVTLSGPAPGRWHFEPAPERIVVLENLQLHVRPEPEKERVLGLVASLTNDDRMLDDPLLGGLVIVQASREAEGPQAPLRVHLPSDASQRYTIDLGTRPLAPDDRVRVQALGLTFEREVEFTLASSAPIRVGIAPGSAGDAVIDVRVLAAGVVANSLHVLGSLKFADGRASVTAGLRQPDGVWQLRAPPLGGTLEATIRIDGNYLNNKEFSITTEPVEIALPVARAVTAEFDLDGRSLGDRPQRPVPPAPPAAPSTAEPPNAVPETARPDAATAPPAERPPNGRKLTRFDAVGAGALVGVNLLALLLVALRVLSPRTSEERTDTRESRLDGALAQYREALAGAASRLGRTPR